VQHLNTKWGSAQCAKGELMLFPNDTRLDTIAVSEKWTLKDSCTAADVHVAVGSPSTFRLRFKFSLLIVAFLFVSMHTNYKKYCLNIIYYEGMVGLGPI
jgi:hypothetical protein